MVTGIAILAVLSLPLQPHGSWQERVTAELLTRARFPEGGRYAIERRSTSPAIDPAAIDASVRRARELQTRGCWLPESKEDREWTLARSHVRDADWFPPYLQYAEKEPQVFESSEVLTIAGPGEFLHVFHLPVLYPDGTVETLTQVSLRTGRDLVLRDFDDGHQVDATTRSRVQGHGLNYGGSALAYARIWARLPPLLSYAEEQGTLRSDGATVTFEVDYRRPTLLESLGAFGPPVGLKQMPGRVLGTYSPLENGALLRLDWRDCGDDTAVVEEVEWRDGQGYPHRIVVERWVPGPNVLARRSVTDVLPLPMRERDLAEVAWAPQPGERIRDKRFAVGLEGTVDYVVGEDGALPPDEEIEALALQAIQEERTRLVWAPADPPPPEPAVRPSEAPRLVTPTPVLQLGEHPVGTTHRVTARIENQGAGSAYLGQVLGDCGCLDPALGDRELAPGEATDLVVNVQVKDVGENRRSVLLHLETGEPVLELFVEVTGTPAPVIFPRRIQGGQLDGRDPASFVLHLTDNGCVPPPTVPVSSTAVFGDVRAEVSWTYLDALGVWRGELVVDPSTAPLGAFSGVLEVTCAGCPDRPASVEVEFDRIPPDGAWPSCRVRLGIEAGSSAELRLPDLEIGEVSSSTGVGLDVQLAQEGSDGVLVLTRTRADTREARLVLDTTRGPVRVLVLPVP